METVNEPVHISEVVPELLAMYGIKPTEVVIHFDGACEPVNPGGVASYGWVLFRDGERVADGCGVLCRGNGATNNLAEYGALGYALRYLKDHPGSHDGAERIIIRGDSQLVVKQINGEWACRAENLIPYRDRCLVLLKQVGKLCVVEWVRREFNEAADAMSRRAYEQETGQDFPETARGARR